MRRKEVTKMLNKNMFNSVVARTGMTHKELSQKIGISKNTLSSKVNNKVPFNVNEIDRICQVLGITDDNEKAQIFLFTPSQNRDT